MRHQEFEFLAQATPKMCQIDRMFTWKGTWTHTQVGTQQWVTLQNFFTFFRSGWPTINWRNRCLIIWLYWLRLLALLWIFRSELWIVSRLTQILYNLIGGKCTPMTWYFLPYESAPSCLIHVHCSAPVNDLSESLNRAIYELSNRRA